MILGSAPVPYISVWVLIPSMSGGGEVIADALVRGISGVVFGGGLNSGLGAGVGVGAGAGVGAAQASKLVANINVKRINVTGIMNFRFISIPLFGFNPHKTLSR